MGVIERVGSVHEPSADMITWPLVGRFLRWRHARSALQVPLLLVAALLVWDGLTGPQLAPKNLATTVTWLHYRGFVVLALLIFGNAFCMACPFMWPRLVAERLGRARWMWPRPLRSKWPGVVLLAAFLFAYELFDLWASPWWTAWVIVAYFLVALAVNGLFRGAPFCKYLCPIGQFNFVGSLISPLEIAVRNHDVCASCTTKDCFRGHEAQRGCELWLFQEKKYGNMDCTFCLDCIHACPHENVGIRFRLPGSELWQDRLRSGVGRLWRRPDVAALVTVFTFGALLNAFGMVSPVYALEAWLASQLGTTSEWPVLGLIFLGALVVEPALLLGGAGWLSRTWSGRAEPLLAVVMRYVYALVPFGMGVWAAHYLFHVLIGFWGVVPIVQNLVGELTGSFWLGRPRWELGPAVPLEWLDALELGFIALGTWGSWLVAYRLACRDAPQKPWTAFLPWAILIGLLALTAVWLMLQPMEMRGTFLA
ncbi:MAG: FesM [Ardenticatenia bacterium]|nr:FesM [Ardenticatenia bacterium]